MIPLTLAALLIGAQAGQAPATLQVSATVAPHCSFVVENAAASGRPAVRASCGASKLHVLRATAGGGAALARIGGRQVRAGGDVLFVVSRTETGRGAVLVTLDF